MNPSTLLKRLSAFLPVAMSLTALATVLVPILALQLTAAVAALTPFFLLRW